MKSSAARLLLTLLGTLGVSLTAVGAPPAVLSITAIKFMNFKTDGTVGHYYGTHPDATDATGEWHLWLIEQEKPDLLLNNLSTGKPYGLRLGRQRVSFVVGNDIDAAPYPVHRLTLDLKLGGITFPLVWESQRGSTATTQLGNLQITASRLQPQAKWRDVVTNFTPTPDNSPDTRVTFDVEVVFVLRGTDCLKNGGNIRVAYNGLVGDGVLSGHSPAPKEHTCVATYKVPVPAAGSYRVKLVYGSPDQKNLFWRVNGAPADANRVTLLPTGGLDEGHQTGTVEFLVEFASPTNDLELSTVEGSFPSLRSISITPE